MDEYHTSYTIMVSVEPTISYDKYKLRIKGLQLRVQLQETYVWGWGVGGWWGSNETVWWLLWITISDAIYYPAL